MPKFKYMILGGGVAAGYSAKSFVKREINAGELCIISAEDRLPYDRPPLSKAVLQHKKKVEEALIEDMGFYEKHGIHVELNTRAERLDLSGKCVYTADGRAFEFDCLLLATGSRVIELDIPGADLDGLFYLRTTDDVQKILNAAQTGQRAVVIGGSFISTEVSASLAQNGIKVTTVYPGKRLLDKLFTPEMSTFYERCFAENGVNLVSGDKVAALAGDGRIRVVVLESGKKFETDFVVAGIGVKPNTDLFADTSLKVDDGVLVDEYLETNVMGVYAAGDIARYPDKIFNKPRRIEHWDTAKAHGEHFARMMLTEREPYIHLPYFFSDVFDLSWEYWGDHKEADDILYRGEVESGQFSTWWLKGDKVVAAFVMNRPDEERDAAQNLIQSQQSITQKDLQAKSLGKWAEANS